MVIYGAGNNAGLALEVLESAAINILAVADKKVGKVCKNFEAVDCNMLCKMNKNVVCIVTPAQDIQEVKEKLKKHFNLVVDMQVIYWMKYFVPADSVVEECGACVPFNHYESPYVQNLDFYQRELERDNANVLYGIDFNTGYQLSFLNKMKEYRDDFYSRIEQQDNLRYEPENGWFNVSDAFLLYSMMRKFKPKKVIEIGSGYSTCVMLDTNDAYLENPATITCIEPYPDRLFQKIKESDRKHIKIYEDFVQNVPISEFEQLEAGDILFIDSSHIVKPGSDITLEYFQILPRLQEGVLVHIHDIFYPFTYPEDWIRQGRAYNEAFIVRALLMNNSEYEILFFNDMITKKYEEEYKELCRNDKAISGGSLWIRKK